MAEKSKQILCFYDALKYIREATQQETAALGSTFENLMKRFLKTEPLYANKFEKIWLWTEFPYKNQFSDKGKDVGIDLVAKTFDGEYWAIQCKCYDKNARIDKIGVDSFLSTSSREFYDENGEFLTFSERLWISTTNNWSIEAENVIRNQNPPVSRINLSDLENAQVNWNELLNGKEGEAARNIRKNPREDQQKAIDKFKKYFETHDRGKLIMACGTGKTYTSLKITEMLAKEKFIKMFNPLSQYNHFNNFKCLFLVPSIALIGQTLKEWSEQTSLPMNAICICSDATASKLNRGKSIDDCEMDNFSLVDIGFPASTNTNTIVKNFEKIRKITKFDEKNNNENGMTVVFSTYQSIDVISEAQKELNKKYNNEYNFDLIICDEAHRTTGVVLNKTTEKEQSYFTKVHSNDFITADKRIYMTATPRLYGEQAKEKAEQNEYVDSLCSMDDENLYGEEVYKMGFSEAVDKGLLSDYRVLVLTVNKNVITENISNRIKRQNEIAKFENNKEIIEEDDAAKLIGCINALSKNVINDDKYIKDIDPSLMKRAVAFCPKITVSKAITRFFNDLKEDEYYNKLFTEEERKEIVTVESSHIDGSMGATEKYKRLSWLKNEDIEKNVCKILTNVKCLSEGVDVPSLDAIMFLSAKNSEVEVVQSVGRVMRKAPNKKYGYIIIPVVIPYGERPDDYLNKTDKFKVVWQVLNALRAHDDRFNSYVNSININKSVGENRWLWFGNISNKMEEDITILSMNKQLQFDFNEYQNKFFVRLVEKVGTKTYYEEWAKDVAEIAKANIKRINDIIGKNTKAKNEFNRFMNKLHKEINPSISEQNAIEMLSQHLITQPVFEALFENYSFSKNNPVSKFMSKIISLLDEQTTEEENEKLQKFYSSVKRRIKDINTTEGKQFIIKELYEKFFKIAFKEMVEKLGIVYTPIEVVDFIIHSVADILKKEFNKDVSDKGVEIIDPFTGTGTFITRLLQSGLIRKEDLSRKYRKEIFANEIVLLAYYIASINIENVYHSLMNKNESYKSFEGICLTDTFQLYEDTVIEEENKNMLLKSDSEENKLMLENSERIKKQKKSKITVVIGNPPYSVGQKSANDNNQNQHYKKLEEKIRNTYVKYSKAQKSSMYDSYIKAFRWASDRIDQETGGIIGFITNSGWIDSNSADGFRHCLEKDFSSIYIFDLKGAIRGKSGETVKKEGQNIFDIMTGVAITILVKNPKIKKEKAKIYYCDVGDYLKGQEKLDILKNYKSILNDKIDKQEIIPNDHNDWLNQRNELFDSYISIEPAKKYDTDAKSYFINYSCGIATARDVWVYNFSKNKLEKNINTTINYYNKQRIEVKKNNKELIKDAKKGNWTDTWDSFLKRNIEIKEDKNSYYEGIYRPFCKENIYYDRYLNERVYQMPSIFPHRDVKNLCICVSGLSSGKGFNCLIIDSIANYDLLSKTQCFPFYYYTKKEQGSLFGEEDDYTKHDGISDFILKRCQDNYKTKNITKENIFYYVYGFLHNENYRNKFQSDLKKMLPRIPLVDKLEDFNKISNIGRQLAELHLNYESVPASKDCVVIGKESNDFYVNKMSFGKNEKDKDKSVIIYNSSIRIENIPQKAYEYVVNGKSAIELVMDRYQVTQDKNSGLTNDPNDWGREHGRPSYILDLLLSVVEVSVITVDLVKEVNGVEVKFE